MDDNADNDGDGATGKEVGDDCDSAMDLMTMVTARQVTKLTMIVMAGWTTTLSTMVTVQRVTTTTKMATARRATKSTTMVTARQATTTMTMATAACRKVTRGEGTRQQAMQQPASKREANGRRGISGQEAMGP